MPISQSVTLLPYVFVSLLGLVLGSFLNVCIVRLPKHESIVAPRSHCVSCGHAIRWYDNIPVLSYLLLGGRCRDCHARISALYPAVEILTALLLAADLAECGLGMQFVRCALLGMLLLVVVFTDFRDRLIPHTVTLFGIGAGLALSLFTPVDNRPLEWLLRFWGFSFPGALSSLLGALTGALAGGGLFYGLGEAFYYFGGREKEYLGFGDVMLMLMIGSFLGLPLTLLTILLGSLGGTLVAVPLHLAVRRFRGYQWPYGSFLGLAAIYVTLGGRWLLESYLRWAGLS